MKREQAESTVAYIYSEGKEKVEKAIKETLGVDTCLEFEIKDARSCGWYITGRDCLSDTYEQMTATPLLRQLFKMVYLRLNAWDAGKEVVFNVAIDYDHNYMGGSNGRDLMMVGINKETGEVTIRK